MSKLCVLGPSGRMGALVVDLCAQRGDLTLATVVDQPGSDGVGTEVAPGIVVTDDLSAAIAGADVYIDFTTPAGTAAAAECARESGCAAVIGTTGLDDGAIRAIDALAEKAPVLVASNFSLGVNLLFSLARRAARALGDEFDLEVVELHHRHKRDAPSGTALSLAKALAEGRGVDFDGAARMAREGEIGARVPGEIGIQSIRGGSIPGEHTAYLVSDDERIELTHKAQSRSIFAAGALRAAAWLVGNDPGHYQMSDVLGL